MTIQDNVIYIPDPNFRTWLQTNYASCMVGNSLITNCPDVVSATNINVSDNNIADLTGIKAFTSLTSLYCSGNQLTSLDISNNTALTSLFCDDNQLTSLDVSNNTALTFLLCRSNQLTSLDVSNNIVLTSLYCSGNQLTSLDISNNTALTYLSCDDNQLTSLDVSNNTALTSLCCENNQLTSLDVSANTALTYLLCLDNQLTSLDVSNNTALTSLCCDSNQLTSLDVSNNTALTGLLCRSNQLTSLNVKNGTNINMSFNAINNSNLTCINVDNATWSTTHWTNIDSWARFNENCSTILSNNKNQENVILKKVDFCIYKSKLSLRLLFNSKNNPNNYIKFLYDTSDEIISEMSICFKLYKMLEWVRFMIQTSCSTKAINMFNNLELPYKFIQDENGEIIKGDSSDLNILCSRYNENVVMFEIEKDSYFEEQKYVLVEIFDMNDYLNKLYPILKLLINEEFSFANYNLRGGNYDLVKDKIKDISIDMENPSSNNEPNYWDLTDIRRNSLYDDNLDMDQQDPNIW